jgi:hypothetical protein
MKEDTSKILELMDKVISHLDNGTLTADENGVKIKDGYRITCDDCCLKGELSLSIGSVILMSYDYPDLKSKMIELRDSIKASRMNHLTNSVIIPMITEVDKKL